MQVGVDEAGKGPVLGSMFAAAVRADPSQLPDGIADSKQLTPARRETLASQIRASADEVAVGEITVREIDEPETDMNSLTVRAQARALQGVDCNEATIITDAGDTNAGRFGQRLARQVAGSLDITAEHGADDEYTIVGAASIIAKVKRDAHVEGLAERFGDIGSGYPSDPSTRRFLADYVDQHGELPPCARTSWQTSQDVLASAEQSSLGEF